MRVSLLLPICLIFARDVCLIFKRTRYNRYGAKIFIRRSRWNGNDAFGLLDVTGWILSYWIRRPSARGKYHAGAIRVEIKDFILPEQIIHFSTIVYSSAVPRSHLYLSLHVKQDCAALNVARCYMKSLVVKSSLL